ncbi:MAG: AAA family ATPase [Deltaproteobacteria bacterium]|nr:AAA family ATPase [Deltaproteobacteria bacterium]
MDMEKRDHKKVLKALIQNFADDLFIEFGTDIKDDTELKNFTEILNKIIFSLSEDKEISFDFINKYLYPFVISLNIKDSYIFNIIKELESGKLYKKEIPKNFYNLAEIYGWKKKIYLRSVEFRNFTVLKDHKFEFSKGINIILGKNKTGKSHLLKTGYFFCKVAGQNMPAIKANETLKDIFGLQSSDKFLSFSGDGDILLKAEFNLENNISQIKYNIPFKGEPIAGKPSITYPSGNKFFVKDNRNFVFIPPKETLSFYRLFLESANKPELDLTYKDITLSLKEPALKTKPIICFETDKITEQYNLGGLFETEDGFNVTYGKDNIPIWLEAEGARKILALIYLIKNGSITPNTTIFWDEPESNLNPELLKLAANILIKLSEYGVQIIVATHSLFFMREFDVAKEMGRDFPLKFFNLYFEDKKLALCSGKRLQELRAIRALDVSVDQFKRLEQYRWDEAKKGEKS